jgi:hypothetical protein
LVVHESATSYLCWSFMVNETAGTAPFRSIMQTRSDGTHTTFAALAELITARGVVEEELELGGSDDAATGNRSRNRLPQGESCSPRR